MHEHVDDGLRGRVFTALYSLMRLCLLLAMAVGPFLSEALDGLSRDQLRDNEDLTEICRLAVRRWFSKAYDKKPVTKVHVVRL